MKKQIFTYFDFGIYNSHVRSVLFYCSLIKGKRSDVLQFIILYLCFASVILTSIRYEIIGFLYLIIGVDGLLICPPQTRLGGHLLYFWTISSSRGTT
ncbi:UNVERIFIED_CONTAM: hypothetical protein RMT77_019165 [Armadillidium vulgare]